MQIIPAEATIAELEKKAAKYERAAIEEATSGSPGLKAKAELCREWIAILKSGYWKS